MANSSLLRMQAHGENRQTLNPDNNGFAKVPKGDEPKTAAVMPDKPKGEPKKKKEEAASLPKNDSGEAVAPAAALEKKAEKPKPSMMTLWRKPGAAEDKLAEDKLAEDKQPAPAAAPTTPVAAPAPAPAPSAAKKRKSAEPVSAGSNGKSYYKKTRVDAEMQEKFEVLICDPECTNVTLLPPPNATAGEITVTWRFN